MSGFHVATAGPASGVEIATVMAVDPLFYETKPQSPAAEGSGDEFGNVLVDGSAF